MLPDHLSKMGRIGHADMVGAMGSDPYNSKMVIVIDNIKTLNGAESNSKVPVF